MKIGPFHLTYCSNVFPGETWDETRANLERYVPQIRRQVWPHGDFGIGLRLSAQAAETLETPEQLRAFQDFLQAQNAYVFTINGFPYGEFHRGVVKENVYLPDWRDRLRLDYTNRLARILTALLPAEADLEGSISTSPGAYKDAIRSSDEIPLMARMMIEHAATLHRLRQESGKSIALALEPEPACLLETIGDTVSFFESHLFSSAGVQYMQSLLGLPAAEAADAIRHHIGVCFDACHMATEFEDMQSGLELLTRAGIRITKVQISSALRLRFRAGDSQAATLLGPFAESTYLHQVVERSAGGLTRFSDLPGALAHESMDAAGIRGTEKEWRVHFHVPIFLENMGSFDNTQPDLIALLDALKQNPICAHLEAETYTWDVLPSEFRAADLGDAIARELAWARDRIR